MPPRTVFFAGKAAPAYHLAKLIIHLINNVAAVIDADPAVRGRLKVLFLPEYNVTPRPAADPRGRPVRADLDRRVRGQRHEQHEVHDERGPDRRHPRRGDDRDGRGGRRGQLLPVRPHRRAGRRQPGLVQTPAGTSSTSPRRARALDLIRSGAFDRGEPGVFAPILDALLTHGDHYMHLADLASYVKAQERAGALYRRPDAWARKAILNVAHSGRFSSDRTIAEYAADVWGAEPCPVD